MVSQPNDSGVTGYVSQANAVGTIGYADYPSVAVTGFPAAKVLNTAGYYTAPTPGHIGLSLLKARPDDLSDVYTDPDPRTYELSWYSSMILPTDTSFNFTAAKGLTLGDFGTYGLCQGQVQAAQLGYAPLPVNLVRAGFDALRSVPGAQVPADPLPSCANPTIDSSGNDRLAAIDPMPQPCDRQGSTQCASPGPGGDVQGETIDVNVPRSEGVFTMTVSTAPVQLSDAVLSADNTSFEATGQLGTVTVSDGRNQSQPGWSISGQVGDFSDGTHSFTGNDLGWTPAVTGAGVGAGPVLPPGSNPGLRQGSVLASAPVGLGTTVLGAGLDLRVPSGTPAGAYSATLTVTAVEHV